MFIRQFWGMIATMAVASSTTIFAQPVQAQSNKFICEMSPDGVYTTYANTPDGTKPVMRWESNYFPPPYTPERRCQEVTGRFNKFHSQGNLQSLTTGRINNSNVVCAGISCSSDNVLVTLKPNQQPQQALDQIIANRAGAHGATVQSSGSSSVTFSLDNYLHKTPVEEVGSSVNATPHSVPSNTIPNRTTSPTNTNPTNLY